MRKALVAGIDYYQFVNSLHGCVRDAESVANVLERNADRAPNFSVKLMRGRDQLHPIPRSLLRDHIKELFSGDPEIALFYFAGHGHIELTGGYLIASDCKSGDEGIALSDVMTLADKSDAKNRIIVLDSCHSGYVGGTPGDIAKAELKEGTTILAASTADQYAIENDGAGVFTSLFVDALSGGAGNLVGDVSPGSVYAHIDQSLGPWRQRPVFKTNVKRFVSLRKVIPPFPVSVLRKIVELFPTPDYDFKLNPSFEPRDEGRTAEMPRANPENTAKFAILQKYNRVNLLVPVDAEHMWNAAMESKSCHLTALGKHYHRLVADGLI